MWTSDILEKSSQSLILRKLDFACTSNSHFSYVKKNRGQQKNAPLLFSNPGSWAAPDLDSRNRSPCFGAERKKENHVMWESTWQVSYIRTSIHLYYTTTTLTTTDQALLHRTNYGHSYIASASSEFKGIHLYTSSSRNRSNQPFPKHQKLTVHCLQAC